MLHTTEFQIFTRIILRLFNASNWISVISKYSTSTSPMLWHACNYVYLSDVMARVCLSCTYMFLSDVMARVYLHRVPVPARWRVPVANTCPVPCGCGDHALHDAGPCQCRAKEVASLIAAVPVHGGPHELFDKRPAQVGHDHLIDR